MPRPDGRPYNFELPDKPKKPDGRTKAVKRLQVAVKITRAKPANELEVIPDGSRVPPATKGRSKAGRPVVYKDDPAFVSAVASKIEDGLFIESALILLGVPHSSVDFYCKKYPRALRVFKQAEAKFEAEMVDNIKRKAQSDPKCSQWLLERRAAAKWAQVTKSELTGKNGGPLASLTLSKVLLASVSIAPDRVKPVKAIKPRLVNGV